jgi:hypothetical protein
MVESRGALAEKKRDRACVPRYRGLTPRGLTATALKVFLTSSHPKMPNLILTPEETADVTAYILRLRDHR